MQNFFTRVSQNAGENNSKATNTTTGPPHPTQELTFISVKISVIVSYSPDAAKAARFAFLSWYVASSSFLMASKKLPRAGTTVQTMRSIHEMVVAWLAA
jgi:hypothetical protein